MQSERFAGELAEQFARDLEAWEEIRPERWRDRPRRQRAQERVTQIARREL